MPDDDGTGSAGPAGEGTNSGAGGPAGEGGTGGAGTEQWSIDKLPAEAQAYLTAELRRQAAAAEAKLRTGTKEAAAKAARDQVMAQLAEAMGLKQTPGDPAELTRQLEQERAATRRLRIGSAVKDAARGIGADPELVEALLTTRGKLAGIDVNTDDFPEQLGTLVAEVVEANPRLRIATGPAPAASGTTATSSFSGGSGGGDADLESMTVEQMRDYLKKHKS